MDSIFRLIKPENVIDTDHECYEPRYFPKGARCAMIILSLGLIFCSITFEKAFIEANSNTNFGLKLTMLSAAAIYPATMSVFYLPNNWRLMKVHNKCGFFSYAIYIIPHILALAFIVAQIVIQCTKNDYSECCGMFQCSLLPAIVLCFLYSVYDFRFESIRYVYTDAFDLVTDITVLLILIAFLLWHAYINNLIDYDQIMCFVLYPVGLLMILKTIKECFSSPRDLDFKTDSWLINLFILFVGIGTVAMVCVKMIVILNMSEAADDKSSN